MNERLLHDEGTTPAQECGMKVFRLMKTMIPVLLAFCMISAAANDCLTIPYQGRVMINGRPFTGAGLFKVAIIDVSGPNEVTLWSNDQTSQAGSEPVSTISLQVMDGIFSLNPGDEEIGMSPLNGLIFHRDGTLAVRVWFNDGIHGSQLLTPDRRIDNPRRYGLDSIRKATTIHVNDMDGNDINDGLTTQTAKKTIQAAIAMLPPRNQASVTVNVTAGNYDGNISIDGIHMTYGNYLTILGDEITTITENENPDIRIFGGDHGIGIRSSSGIRLVGMHISEANTGIYITNSSDCIIQQMKAENNIRDGILLEYNASASIRDSFSVRNGKSGLGIMKNSSGYISGCDFAFNIDDGVNLYYNSVAHFSPGTTYLKSNLDYGMQSRFNSTSDGSGFLNFSGNALGGTNFAAGSIYN